MTRELRYDPPASTTPPAPEHGAAPPEAIEGVRPSGPAAAVVLAAGLASFALGVLSVLTAASTSVAAALTLSDRVGEISGLSTAVAALFFASWGALTIVWRHADPPLARVAATTGVLVALGLLGTFPPFFRIFSG